MPDGQIYLAGPFFNVGQQWVIDEARGALQDMGFNVFYFSFMEDSPETVSARFQTALYRFAADSSKIKTFIASIKKLVLPAAAWSEKYITKCHR